MSDDLERFFSQYAVAFNAADVDRLADFFHAPCLMINNDAVALLDSEGAVRDNLTALCDYHEQQGVRHATVERMSCRLLGSGLSLATIEWKVERSGELLAWEFCNTYNLVSRGGRWRIVVSTTHGQFHEVDE